MKHRNRRLSRPWGAVCLLAIALLSVCLGGCSGEVYSPNGEALTLPPAVTEDPSGGSRPSSSNRPYEDAPHVLRADFLKTGKSDVILLQADGIVILVDTGDADDFSTISQCLREYGITEIDYLIITHFDNDHIGSAATVLQNYGVKTVFLPDYIRDSSLYRRMMDALELLPEVEVRRVTETITLEVGIGRVEIQPTALYEGGLTLGKDGEQAEASGIVENNYSLITTVTFGQRSILLMGDAEKARIREYETGLGGEARFDLIKIPHHGDSNKALREWLSRCEGLRYCVVHADGPYEVDASLVSAVHDSGAVAYYTYDGWIQFATDGESMSVLRG